MTRSAPPALTVMLEVQSAAKYQDEAQHASAHRGSHKMQSSELRPREPIALQPFQRQPDGQGMHSHAGKAGTMPGSPSNAPQSDPQMEALLREAQAQPTDAMMAAYCLQNWQDLTASTADSYSSDPGHVPIRQPMVFQEAHLKEETQTSRLPARPAAPVPKAQQDMPQGREAIDLRLHEACPSKRSRPVGSSPEAANAAQTETAQDSSDMSEDMQAPSTPAGRPGRDNAMQDGGEQKQQPGMASLLQQDVASLKGQVRPLARHQDDPLQ